MTRHRLYLVAVAGSAHAPGGFIGKCVCGWSSPELRSWDDAERAVDAHVAAETPR